MRPGRLALALITALHLAPAMVMAAQAEDGMVMAAPKRVGPPRVAPVQAMGLRIEAVHWGRERGLGQNGGHVEAFDLATGKPVWLKQVYPIRYDPHLEEDVQDRFIKQLTLAPDGHTLQVTDERGQRFEIDLAPAAKPDAPCNTP